MPQEIVSKYKLTKLLQPDSVASTIVDKNLKLIWYNHSFEDFLKANKVKPNTFSSLLSQYDFKKIKKNKALTLKLNLKNNILPVFIKPLTTGKKIDGYLIKIKISSSRRSKLTPVTKSDSEFMFELQNILTLLIKENSLPKLSNEIIKKCISLSKSDYAITVYNIQEEAQKYDIAFYDPEDCLLNSGNLRKDIASNFSFLIKSRPSKGSFATTFSIPFDLKNFDKR